MLSTGKTNKPGTRTGRRGGGNRPQPKPTTRPKPRTSKLKK